MMLPKTQPQVNPLFWNSLVGQFTGAHVLQTWEWGKVKSQFGWQPNYLAWLEDDNQYRLIVNHFPLHFDEKKLVGAALALQRNIRAGGFAHAMGILYIPKGPLIDWANTPLRHKVYRDLHEYAQKRNAIFIKIDPDLELGNGIPGDPDANDNNLGNEVIKELTDHGWLFSEEQVQFRNTVVIDLRPSEEILLTNMKQKTRYNINLAARKGVTVRAGCLADIDMLIRMYAETSIRDGFTIRSDAYYREVWSTFLKKQPLSGADEPYAEALIAEVNGEAVAGIIIFRFRQKAWYLYGMSRDIHRDKMPNYLLQWEAIKRSKDVGCNTYDLWGAPDKFIETDPLWGVYRFKEGLGGTVHRSIGAWDLPENRMLYRLYTKTLPGLLDIMRIRGRASTKQVLG